MRNDSDDKVRNKSNDKMRTNNIIRYVFVALIVVPCFIVAGLVIVRDDFKIPWPAVAFYGLGLLAIRFLFVPPTPEETPEDDKGVYLSARKQLVDWIKVQGVVITVFLGIVGFYVMKEAVRDTVSKVVEPHVNTELKKFEVLIIDANDRLDRQITNTETKFEDLIADANTVLAQQMKKTQTKLSELVNQAEKAQADAISAEREATKVKNSSQEMLDQVTQTASEANETLNSVTKHADKLFADAEKDLSAYRMKARQFAIEQETLVDSQRNTRENFDSRIARIEEQTRRFLLVATKTIYGSQETPDLVKLLDEQSKGNATSEQLEGIITVLEDRKIDDKQAYTLSLTSATRSQYARVRTLAANALGNIRGYDSIVVRSLMNLLGERSPYVSQESGLPGTRTTGEISPRVAAAKALGKVGSPVAARRLILAIRDRDPYVRREAAYALVRIREPADEIVKALSGALVDSTLEGREVFADAIGILGPSAKAASPTLVSVVTTDENINIRQSAAVALTKVEPDSNFVVPAVLKLLKSRQLTNRSSLAQALGRLGNKAKSAVPDLVEMLEAGELAPIERREFVKTLGLIGDSSAQPILIQTLDDEYPSVRDAALLALKSFAFDKTVIAKSLAKQLQKASSLSESRRIIEDLSELGMSARLAVPTLLKLLETSNDINILQSIVVALGRIQASSAVPDLAKIFNDPNISDVLRTYAATALGRIATPDAQSVLVNALDDPDLEIVLKALETLSEAGHKSDEVVSRSIELLQNPNFPDKSKLAEILGTVGSAAKPAIPEILKLVSDSPDPHTAAEALGSIGDPSAVDGLL